MDLPLKDAQRIVEALSAFKTFKTPQKLPDRLRLSRKQISKVLKWYKVSKEAVNDGTFTSMNFAALQTQKTFSGLGKSIKFFDKNDEEDENTEEEDDDSSDDDSDFNDVDFLNSFPGFGSGGKEINEDMIEKLFSDMMKGFDGNAMLDGMDENSLKGMLGNSLGGMMTEMTHNASNMVQPMMKMMDKTTMYKPVMAAIETLGPWIDSSRNILEPAQIEKLEKQLQLYNDIKELLDEEKEDDEPHEKEARGAMVVELSQEVQKIGPLPAPVTDAMNKASTTSLPETIPNIIGQMGDVMTEGMSHMFSGGPKAVGGTAVKDDADSDNGEGEDANCTIL